MKSRDFVYWHQGFFELTNAKIINSKQFDLIKKHLALVFANVEKDNSEAFSFCQWLNGCFDIIETKTFNIKQVNIIREKLNAVFEHEIDPLFTNREKLEKIHNPQFFPYNHPDISCDTTLTGITDSYIQPEKIKHSGQSISMSYSTSMSYIPSETVSVRYPPYNDINRKFMC